MTADEAIQNLSTKYDLVALHTRADVATILTEIAPPGEEQAVKRAVIDRLFPQVSPQGYKTVDDLANYSEY